MNLIRFVYTIQTCTYEINPCVPKNKFSKFPYVARMVVILNISKILKLETVDNIIL